MRRTLAAVVATTTLAVGAAAPELGPIAFGPCAASATVVPGDVGPAFTKNALGGGSVSLSDYSGKVVVLFLLGYA
jgi:hypothetical protein